ncbi:MAG TPA: general secretion pathway protein GspB, partial [Noviherbaspirillum sp.]|nr:general secretion pathway protein GspB [Noviherbaspirillum sp.]
AAATVIGAPPQRRNPWPWIALAGLAGALAAFFWLRPQPPVPTPPPVGATQLPPAAPVPAAPQPEAQAVKPAADEPRRKAPASPPESKAEKAVAAKKAVAPASPPQLATLHDLPAALQNQIPKIKIGGYIYSANKAERSVLINDRLVTEGDEVAPGLVLERMLPDGMVMRYRGYQYRMRY